MTGRLRPSRRPAVQTLRCRQSSLLTGLASSSGEKAERLGAGVDGLRGLRAEGEGVADAGPGRGLCGGHEPAPGGVGAVGDAFEDVDAVLDEAADLAGGGCGDRSVGLCPGFARADHRSRCDQGRSLQQLAARHLFFAHVFTHGLLVEMVDCNTVSSGQKTQKGPPGGSPFSDKNNSKGEIQGSLHCAADDKAVRCFGRDDIFWFRRYFPQPDAVGRFCGQLTSSLRFRSAC